MERILSVVTTLRMQQRDVGAKPYDLRRRVRVAADLRSPGQHPLEKAHRLVELEPVWPLTEVLGYRSWSSPALGGHAFNTPSLPRTLTIVSVNELTDV